VTNSKALRYEFPDLGQDVTVSELLQEAYGDADEQRIVYDLADYFDEMPWGLFTSYNEQPLSPNLHKNEYTKRISTFVKEKCGACKSIIILGDDYIVPHYRTVFEIIDDLLFHIGDVDIERRNQDQERMMVFSDIVYIPQTQKTFAEFDDLFIKGGDPQDVEIVIPRNADQALRREVDNLKDSIEQKYTSDVEIREERGRGCNFYNEFEDKTVILVGNRQSNNFISCLPHLEENIISIERNVWSENQNYALVLNINENLESLYTIENIVRNGPEEHWTFSRAMVACLWDGKFSGEHRFAQEMSCNIIPLVELAPDLRDSGRCLFGSDRETEEGMAQEIICTITHTATGYDLTTWGLAIFTFGGTGVGGEVFDVGIATLKTSIKTAAKNVARKFGRDSVDTIVTVLKSPVILKDMGIVLWEIGRHPGQSLTTATEGLVGIARHGRRATENTLELLRNSRAVQQAIGQANWAIDHVGFFGKAADIFGTKPLLIGNLPPNRIARGLKTFDEETIDSFELVKEWGAFDELEGLALVEAGSHDIGAIRITREGKKYVEIDDGMRKVGNNGLDEAEFKELIKHNVIFHEAGHDLVQKQYIRELPEWFDSLNGKFYFVSTTRKLEPVAEILADTKALEQLNNARKTTYLEQQEIFLTRRLEKQNGGFTTFAEDQVAIFKANIETRDDYVGNIARVYYEADVNALPQLRDEVNQILDSRSFKDFVKQNFNVDEGQALVVIRDIKTKAGNVAQEFLLFRQNLEAGFPNAATMRDRLQRVETAINENLVVQP